MPCRNISLSRELDSSGALGGVCGHRLCAPESPSGAALFCFELSTAVCESYVVRKAFRLHACKLTLDGKACKLGPRCGTAPPPAPPSPPPKASVPCRNVSLPLYLEAGGALHGICGRRSCAPLMLTGEASECHQLAANQCEGFVVRLAYRLHACSIAAAGQGCTVGPRCIGNMAPPPPLPPPLKRRRRFKRRGSIFSTTPCTNASLRQALEAEDALMGICGHRTCAPQTPRGQAGYCFSLSPEQCERHVVRMNTRLHACQLMSGGQICGLGPHCSAPISPPSPPPLFELGSETIGRTRRSRKRSRSRGEECGPCIALLHLHKSAGTTLIRILEHPQPTTQCGGIYYCNWRQYKTTSCQGPTLFPNRGPTSASGLIGRTFKTSRVQVTMNEALRWEAKRQDIEHARLYYGGYISAMSHSGSRVRKSCLYVALFREPIARMASIALYCRYGVHMGTGIPAWLPTSRGGDVLCGGRQNGNLSTWSQFIGNQLFRQLAIQPVMFAELTGGKSFSVVANESAQADEEVRSIFGPHEKAGTRTGRLVLQKAETAIRIGEMPSIVGIFEQMDRTLLLFDKVIPLNGGRSWVREASRLAYTHNSARWTGERDKLLREAPAVATHLAADLRLYRAGLKRFEQLWANMLGEVSPPPPAGSFAPGWIAALSLTCAACALVRVVVMHYERMRP